MSSPRKKENQYSVEFKESTVRLVEESDQTVAQIARNLGINSNTLHGWLRKYQTKKVSQSISAAKGIEDELKRLRKELARVTMERDILKKATAYFAKEAR